MSAVDPELEAELDLAGIPRLDHELYAKVTSLRDDPQFCKCPRCWHYHAVKENYDELCDRCCHVLVEAWPEHDAIPGIQESWERQRAKYTSPPT